MARWADRPQSDRNTGGRARRATSSAPDRGRRDRQSALWAAGIAVALMAMGFKRRPHAEAAGEQRQDRSQTRRVRRSDNPTLRQSHAGGDALRAARSEHDRGRAADTPSEIPARGWKDILLRIYHNLSEHRVIAIAAGVTFYALLAIFPAIAALVSVYGLFADAKTISDHLASASTFLPGGALDILGEQLQRLTAQPGGKLGLTFFTGLAISLWSANAGIKALFDALNIVYGEKEKRSFIKLNAVSLAFTVGGLIFALVAMAAVVALPVVLSYIGLGRATELLFTIGRWPILFAAVALWIALIYRYGPSRDTPQWRWVTWGSACASLAWIVLSILFSWYAANFGSYNKTYGSLGAAIGFMTWIWLSTIVVLLGAELDAEMEHQTARDTTTGAPQPLGARGAAVADTIGAAQD
ncbi:MAG: YihY/virulence factor BrkB family protein [Xanthobacteraceae bacterium]